jgi:hypothetical protein
VGFSAELVRPDDLLHLRVTGSNLVLDPADPEAPVVVVEDPAQPAFLVVTFPPQSLAEAAFFEWDVVKAEDKQADGTAAPRQPNDPPPTGMAHEPLDPPGQPQLPRLAAAQMARPSRLVFRVPNGTSIPFTLAGLLDWSGLELSVGPIAAIGDTPTAAQIAKAPPPAPPAPTETAIELPYRLVISPTADVAWVHRDGAFTRRGRTELWHTRLVVKRAGGLSEASPLDPAPLRAVWSEDYRPADPPEPVDVDPALSRTAMAPNDRYQLVVLTSAFHGWEVDEQFLWFAGRGRAPRLEPITLTVPYVPQPFHAAQLMLSPLGGWLKSRGDWNPPRPAPPPPVRHRRLEEVVRDALLDRRQPAAVDEAAVDWAATSAVAGGPAPLDLSEWVHQATLGRDHYVRIVYEGELWPFRHRAALVKVTERKFEERDGVVGAYLMQRMFIVVREPEKAFTDRGNPFRKVRLTTLVTPNIAPPTIVTGTHRTFWVEVVAGADPVADRKLFPFHGVGTDVGGNEVDFTVPLLFVSISDVGTPATSTLRAVAAAYNATSMTGRRDLSVPGQQILFAQPAGNHNTRLVADTVNFVVDGHGSPPRMLKAEVRIPQVQELLGTDAATTIAFHEPYVTGDFDAAAGVFARIARHSAGGAVDTLASMVDDTVGVNFSAEKAGGMSTPNMAVSALTRELGPVAGKVADAATGAWNPSAFFPAGTAELFGTFDLKDLLSTGNLAGNAPAMVSKPVGAVLETTLTWTPTPSPVDLVIAAFQPKGATTLRITGTIRKPLDGATPPTSEFKGTLNDFEVSVLKSVVIAFVEFGFVARTGQKTDVTVKLDQATPVRFAGDLTFVEEIRNAIPPDLFGDGPSLDISPTGIRAGFSFALPPLAVGVFALKDVSLGAALTLPFTDGKPVFDFNVSERAHPFLLTVSLFGGGGFFHLQLDTAGMKSLEIALEFGAAAAIDIGVASGEVHIMAGIYFGLQRKEGSTELAAVLTGYLRMGGSLSVLGLVKISVEFNLSFTYDSGRDKAFGRATLTVQVKVVCFSKSVSMTVERAFGGSGDPTFAQLVTGPDPWAEYAGAFA